MRRGKDCFWSTSILDFQILQGSVATQLRWGGSLYNISIQNFLWNLTVKELWKSVFICRSYDQTQSGCFFLEHHHHHNRFTALFPGPPRWAGARRELLDFMVQGKINRGRHTNHPAGRHTNWTKQSPPPPSPSFFTGWRPILPPNQQCQSTEGNTVYIITNQLKNMFHSDSALC